jgi:hypothetical protein
MVRRDRPGVGRARALSPLVALMALGAATVAFAGPSAAATEGSGAFGYSLKVSLFGADQPPIGPVPSVTLPAAGSPTPVTASAPTGNAKEGPATFFSSGQLEVSTQGTPGAGSVTSSAKIANVNSSGQESFTASSVTSTCTASGTSVSGSTTIAGGKLETDNGDDDPQNETPDHPAVSQPVPANPAPNTTVEGHIEVNGQQDRWRYVFNEQITNPDGSITVNAAHEYILGPTAKGDLFIGQARCSKTAGTSSGPAAAGAPTTTKAGGTAAAGSGGQSGSPTGSGAANSNMPKTGAEVRPLVLAASALVLAGAMAVFWASRRVWRAWHPRHGLP